MISRFLIILILTVSLVGGCGRRHEKALPPPAIKVGCVAVEKGDIIQTLNVSGNLHFIAITTVSAEVAAQVKSIDVRDGQLVKKDQTLLTFDDSTFRAVSDQAKGNLQKDEATLAFNKAEWEKNLPLRQSGAISQSSYDQKLSAYQSAMGQVEADKGVFAKAVEDLKHTVEYAPIAGILSNRYVEKGDWVSVGTKLFDISDYSTIYLETFVSDKDVGKLDIGKVIREGYGIEAEVSVDSLPGKTFRGKVGYIQPVTNQNRLFEVRIYIDNQDMKLLQGMYARAGVVVKRIPDVVRIPVDALLEQVRNNDSNAVVRVGEQSKAEIARIKIGAMDSNYVEVLGGLNIGDKVVVEGKEILSNGQPLEVAVSSTAKTLTFSEDRAK